METCHSFALMRRRDADKLPAADSVNRNATAADLMRHACTKDHAPGLDPGPSAWHITKVTKHVARAKQQESAGQQSGEKRTVARLHSQRCTRCTAEVLTWLQTAPSRSAFCACVSLCVSECVCVCECLSVSVCGARPEFATLQWPGQGQASVKPPPTPDRPRQLHA